MAKQETFVVFGTDGMIDRDASTNAFIAELDRQCTIEVELRQAVHTIFNRYPTANLETEPFVRLVLNQMEIDPFEQKNMKENVMNYVQNSPEFKIFRGARGGVRRISDIEKK